MKPEIKQRWIEALRSGEYKQGTTYLRQDNSYCCLGVLCDLYNKDHYETCWEPVTKGCDVYAIDGSGCVLPSAVEQWSGLLHCEGKYGEAPEHRLTVLNDDGLSFQEISNIIEEHF